jgi:REP element-mobilizing transposase RayT
VPWPPAFGNLGEACAKTGWQVHAYVLMSNHFHLVLETPQANLCLGMKWLLGTFTQRLVWADSNAASRTACTFTPSWKSGRKPPASRSDRTKSATWCTKVCS